MGKFSGCEYHLNTDVILKNYTRNNIGLSDGDPQTKNFNE